MQQSAPPLEWVEGAPKTWFFLGNFAVLFGALYVGQLISQLAIPANWGPAPVVLLAWCGIIAAIAVPVNALYFLSVPSPQTVGLSPVGVTIDFGLRRKVYAWRNVLQRERELICFPARGPWPTRVALSSRQRDRVRAWISVYPSSRT